MVFLRTVASYSAGEAAAPSPLRMIGDLVTMATPQKTKLVSSAAALYRSQIIDLLCSPYATKRSVIIEGPTGTGKSDILKDVSARLGIRGIYFDCQTKGLEDITCPMPVEINGMTVMRSVPHEEFGLQFNERVIIMLDEIAKNKALIPGIARMLHERAIGTYFLPPGSIVFGTTNLALENFGDMIPGFIRSRCAPIRMKNTEKEAFEEYMIGADFDPSMIAAVHEKPDLIKCFLDNEDPKDNPWIYDPRDPSRAVNGFSCPRSLHNMSDLLKDREMLGDEIVTATAAGIVGPAAAGEIMNIVRLGDELPKYSEIVAAPKTTRLPSGSGAQIISALTCMQRVEEEDFDAVFTYVKRLPMPMQGMFASGLMRSKAKGHWLVRQRSYTEFSRINYAMFTPV